MTNLRLAVVMAVCGQGEWIHRPLANLIGATRERFLFVPVLSGPCVGEEQEIAAQLAASGRTKDALFVRLGGAPDALQATRAGIDAVPRSIPYIAVLMAGVVVPDDWNNRLVAALEAYSDMLAVMPTTEVESVGFSGGGATIDSALPQYVNVVNDFLGRKYGGAWYEGVEDRNAMGRFQVAVFRRKEFDRLGAGAASALAGRALPAGHRVGLCKAVYAWSSRLTPIATTRPAGPLSVCIAVITHNYGHWLARSLSSVFGQTAQVDRVLVVDDASEKSDCAESVAASFPVEYIRTNFANANRARNVAFRRSTEDAILFLDADDWLAPKAIEIMATKMRETGADVVYGDCYRVFEHGMRGPLDRRGLFQSQPFSLDELRSGRNFIIMPSLIRQAGFSGFDGGIEGHQDWDAWLAMGEMGRRFEYVHEPLVYVWVHGESLSRRGDDELRPLFNAVAKKHGLSVRYKDVIERGFLESMAEQALDEEALQARLEEFRLSRWKGAVVCA